MKKVRIAACGLLPVAGIAAGTFAPPANAAVKPATSPVPLTGQGCVAFSGPCTSVNGSGLHVKYIKIYDAPYHGTAYIGYKNAAGFAPKSKWRTGTIKAGQSAYTWQMGQCYFPNGTDIYTWVAGHASAKPVVGIHGSDYLKSKACL